MNKYLISLSIPAAIILSACSSSTKSPSGDTMKADSLQDSIMADNAATPVANIPFEVKKFSKKKGENELSIEYPVEGNPLLLEAIRKWINERLGDSYRGDLNNPEAFFNHYAAQMGTDPEFDEFGGYIIDDFKLEFINDYIVTYNYTSYEYAGGAHGMGGSFGTTFLQADGQMFDKKCITSYKPLHNLFIEGLKRYFKVSTDAQLKDNLMDVSSLASLNDPGSEPWIDKDGVVFSYTPYEIAPYSAGAPSFTIPFAQIESYLTPEGLRFFGK